MALKNKLSQLIADPPPAYFFELSEAGIAYAVLEQSASPGVQFRPLEAGVLSVSPLHDNVQRPEILAAQVAGLIPLNGGRKRRRAALILPDYVARVAVLDFDAFPADPAEQLALVRFRI